MYNQKFKLNRRGQTGAEKSSSMLMDIFLVILAFIGVTVLVLAIFQGGDKAAKDIVCRDSVVVRGKAALVIEGITISDKMTPLLCNPQDEGEIRGTREDIKKEIAQLTTRCWFRFAEGIVSDIFKGEQNERQCRPCFYFKIPKGMDEGKTYFPEYFPQDQLTTRRPDNLTAEELYNYLAANEYNPALVRGGGTRTYIGDKAIFMHDIKLDEYTTRNVRDINELPVGGTYFIDFTGVLTAQDQTKINDVGKELATKNMGRMLVIIADEFYEDIYKDASAARRIIENTKLNSGPENYDSILLLVDIKHKTVRLAVGRDLEWAINEFDIFSMLDSNFDERKNQVTSKEDLSARIAKAVGQIREDILGENLPTVNPKSYYSYISNAQSTFPFIDDVQSESTYVVAYMSNSALQSFAKGFFENSLSNIPLTVIGWGTNRYDVVLKTLLGARINNKPNHIVITKAHDLAAYCTPE